MSCPGWQLFKRGVYHTGAFAVQERKARLRYYNAAYLCQKLALKRHYRAVDAHERRKSVHLDNRIKRASEKERDKNLFNLHKNFKPLRWRADGVRETSIVTPLPPTTDESEWTTGQKVYVDLGGGPRPADIVDVFYTTMTDSYYCSKGCASMSSEDIVNLEKSARRRLSPKKKNVATSRRRYCTSLDGESTYAKCVNNCQTASANVQHVGECEYGCEYWALLPEEEPEETVTKTKASYVSKSSWNEVAFIAVLGCIIVLLLGYRRRRMRLRSGASQPYVPIKTVYNNGTEVL